MRKTIRELVVYLMLLVCANSQCCLFFQGNSCVQCPHGMHLYRNNCLFDIPNCIEYAQGFDCQKCKSGYYLSNGTCFHTRFNLDQEQLGPFTPYLHSAIKPDSLFQTAQEQLTSDKQLWLSWYNHSAIQNRTFLSSNTLTSRTEALMKRIVSPKSILHYICTSNFNFNGTLLHIYRLTYQVAGPYGFVDIIFALQPDGEQVGYMEIVKVTATQLSKGDWFALNEETAAKIGQLLRNYFTDISNQALMNGFWQPMGDSFNMTLFYMDGRAGVMAYNYQATKEDLADMGIAQPSQTITPQQPSKNSPVLNTTVTQTSNSSANAANYKQNVENKSTTVQQPIDSNISPAEPSPLPTTNSTSKKQRGSQVVESMMSLDELMGNPIFATGYAVAIQQGYVSAGAEIVGLSYFANNSYSIYFKDSSQKQPFSKIIFYIDLTIQQFRIASFQKSTTIQLPPISTKTNPASPSNNSTSSGSQNNSSVQNYSSNSTQPKPTNNNGSASPIPANNKSNPTPTFSPAPNTTVDMNSTTLVDCPQLSQFQNVQIKQLLKTDVFLPKINLLLTTIYKGALTNCQLSAAHYSWRVGTSALVSTIIYSINYECPSAKKLQFVAEITNNELKIVTVPEGIKEGSEVPQAAAQNQNTASVENVGNGSNKATVANNGSASSTKVPSNNASETANSTNATDNTSSSSSKRTEPINNTVAPPTPVVTPVITPIINSTTTTINASANKTDNNAGTSNNAGSNTHFVIVDNTKPSSFFDSLINTPTKRIQSNKVTPSTVPKTNISSTPSSTQQQSKPSPSATTPQQGRSTVKPEDYTKDPQIRILIQIVRDSKQIPRNSSVSLIEKWQDDKLGECYYVVFQMRLRQPLQNGSNVKVFMVDIQVLPGTLRQLKISDPRVDYRQENSGLLSSASSSDPLLKSQFSHLQTSLLEQRLVEHSPYLRTSISSSLRKKQLNESFGGLKAEYRELVRFQSAQFVLCYEAAYEVIKSDLAESENLVLKEYHLQDCDKNHASSQTNLSAVAFKDAPLNDKISGRLSAIAKSNISIYSNQQYNNIYKVQYQSDQWYYQTVIDASNQLVLSFSTQQKSAYMVDSLNQDKQVRALEQSIQMGSKFKGTIKILRIHQTKTHQELQFLNVLLGQEIEEGWGITINKYYKLQVIKSSSQKTINVVSMDPISVPIYNKYNLNYRGLQYYRQIPLDKMVNTPQLGSIVSQIKTNYSSFLMNCQIILSLVTDSAAEDNYFNTSYQQNVTLKLLISKKYTPSYYAHYLITFNYLPATVQATIKGVQALTSQNFQVSNCLKSNNFKGIPMCNQCYPGYYQFEGVCYPQIEKCTAVYQNLCLSCQYSQPSFFFDACESTESRSVALESYIQRRR